MQPNFNPIQFYFLNPSSDSGKRKSPQPPTIQLSEQAPVQPLKKTDVKSLSYGNIGYLFFFLFKDRDLKYDKIGEGIYTVSDVINAYTLRLSATQETILFGNPLLLSSDEFLSAMTTPIEAFKPNGERYSLTLLSVFFEKSTLASQLSHLAKQHLNKCRVPFTAEMINFLLRPVKEGYRYLNPLYYNHLYTAISYLKEINGSNVFPSGNLVSEQKSYLSTLVCIPSQDVTYWSNLPSTTLLETRAAQDISSKLSTPYLTQIKYLRDYCQLQASHEEAVFSYLGFTIAMKGFGCFLDSYLVKKVLAHLLQGDLERAANRFNVDFFWILIGNKRSIINPSKTEFEDFLDDIHVIEDEPLKFRHRKIEYVITKTDHSDRNQLSIDSVKYGGVQTRIFLGILARQVSPLEIRAFRVLRSGRESSTYTISFSDDTMAEFTLTRLHINALTALDELNPQEILEAFNSPIVCAFSDAEFSFSLYALLFSSEEYANKAIATLIRKYSNNELRTPFLVHASQYCLLPLSSFYVNPEYRLYADIYVDNLLKLNGNGKILCDKTVVIDHEIPFETVNIVSAFPFIPFAMKEARSVINHEYKGNNLPYYIKCFSALRKAHDVLDASPTQLILSRQTHTGNDIAKHINELFNISAFHNITALMAGLSSENEPISHKYTHKGWRIEVGSYYFIVSHTQYEIIFRKTPLANNYRHISDALSNPINIYKTDSNAICTTTSLLSLLFLDSPATASLILHINRLKNPVFTETMLAAAVRFALDPFVNKGLYLNPKYREMLRNFYRNLTKLNNGISIFPSNIGLESLETGTAVWKFVPFNSAIPLDSIPNIYGLEAESCLLACDVNRTGLFATKFTKEWAEFIKHVTVLHANKDAFQFSYKNERYTLTTCIAESDIYKKVLHEASFLKEMAEVASTQPVNIDSDKAKVLIPSLLKPFNIPSTFTFSAAKKDGDYLITINSEETTYELSVSASQLRILLDRDYSQITLNDFITAIPVHIVGFPSKKWIGETSLFSLFFGNSPYLERLKKSLGGLCSDVFFAQATYFAVFAFKEFEIYVNPELSDLLATFHHHLKELNNGNDSFAGFSRAFDNINTGKVVWKFYRQIAAKYPKYYLYHLEARKAANEGADIFPNSEHIQKWDKFRSKVKIQPGTTMSTLIFEHNHSVYTLSGPSAAASPLFNEILNSPHNALSVNQEGIVSAAIGPATINTALVKRNIKALLRPFADDDFSYRYFTQGTSHCLSVNSSRGNFIIRLNDEQYQIILGLIPHNFDCSLFAKDILVEKILQHNDVKINTSHGTTCLFTLFYEKNEFIEYLKNLLKPIANEAFFREAAKFALAPLHTHNHLPLKYFVRPEFLKLIDIFFDHLIQIKGNNVFQFDPTHLDNVSKMGKWPWVLEPCTLPVENAQSLYSLEHLKCASPASNGSLNFVQNEHIEKWNKFYTKAQVLVLNEKELRVKYREQTVAFEGAAISQHPLFIQMVNREPLSNQSAKSSVLPNNPPQASPKTPLIIPSETNAKRTEEYIRIANIIETYWFKNPVNYSRWIKLLRESRSVFSFESLPLELMEPLKGFKKEYVALMLKYLGVCKDSLFIGDLPDDLVEKSVPTLLRVKAAEFQLLKKNLNETRRIQPIEFRNCLLVKSGPRFVHVIKVKARFDEQGLISGFVLNGRDVFEKNVPLEEFNKMAEKAIVLERETVKLVEEAPELDSPPRPQKREREEEQKEKIEREQKGQKTEPILPKVPEPRVQKRPAPHTDGTVHPHAPKESRFTDKGDIATDRTKAIGIAPHGGGIVPPPQIIDKPPEPAMETALSLDDLFNALSKNAVAQVNHTVKGSLNYLKAVFAEEPLVYEGLQYIRKLMDTPLPIVPCLVPKAKKYQWELVLEVEKRELAGLGTILAPYMGLGKTWIYVSKILLSVYKGANGHHFIITPKPLRETIRKDAVFILNNARINAFIQLKSIKLGEWCIKQIIQESNLDEKRFLLSLLGLFKEEEFNKIMIGRGPITNELCSTFVENKFSQYPTKLKRLYEYSKSIAPKDLPNRGNFDEKGLERILHLTASRIRKCENGKELVAYSGEEPAQIIIASYEQAEHLANNPICSPGCASLIFDEAQYIHNPETAVSKTAERLLKELKPKGKIAVTGTPIENGVEDLFQLVKLMAPELNCPAILATLSNLSINAGRYVKAKDRDLALTHLLKLHGHLQAYLARVSQNLVILLQKDDPRVKEAWGEGAVVEYSYDNISIPALARQKYLEAHELFKTRKIDPTTGKKLDTTMAYYSRVANILLDPELRVDNLTKKDSSVQRLLKWIKAETDMAKIDALIARSAILSAILNSPKTRYVIDEKKVALIFVANIAVGKVIRKVLKKKFEGIESYLMYGDQNDVKEIKGDKKEIKKDIIIEKLKETGKTKFGILSIESGSAGFSIPDAAVTIMSDLSYNVATEMQAIARMVRATSSGLKQVQYLRFGIFSEAHIPIVQEIKKLTFKSFFTPAETQLERFKDSVKLIRNNIYQSYLNEKRDVVLADEAMIEIDELINSMTDSIDEEELTAFVQRLVPPLPAPVLQPALISAVAKNSIAPPLRIAGNKLFKLPLPSSMADDDKVRLAHYIQCNRKTLDAQIKEIYSQLKNPELRNFVRTGSQMPSPESTKAYQTLMDLIKAAKTAVLSIDDIGIDLFTIVGQDYVQEEKTKAESSKRVKLVKGSNNIIEILI